MNEPEINIVIFPDDLIDLESRANSLTEGTSEYKVIKLRLGLARSLFAHYRESNPDDYQSIIKRIREHLDALGL